ncbi:hypothetical protein SDC9_41241 [bioreactor metagenome]|uniref:Uncharacterized protein n=1 Tax=bioreactor metagenome TaxID=1076179 RepID=A0A644VUN4_9ZZZZ
MIDWGIYETRLGVAGVVGRDRAVTREREAVLRKYMSSPSLKTVSVNGADMYLLINSTDKPSEKKFNALPDEVVNIGDIILWQEMHWLVTQVDFDDEVSRSGRIVQCNRQVRWQNPITYEIVERWCLVTKPYTSNIDEGTTISTSNREFKVQLPFDVETRLLDIDKRFMLEVINGKPRTYSCTSVDQQTNKYQDIDGGFIVINIKQDEAGRAEDRTDLMICDYKEPPNNPEPSPTLLKCEITGRSNIRVGMSRKYTATFYDEDGTTPVEGVVPVWSVDVPAGYESYVTWSTNGDLVEINVADAAAIGQVFAVSVVDDEGLYNKATMSVEVVDMYG